MAQASPPSDKLKLPSGTRDIHPSQAIQREQIRAYIASVYKKYGALPIDTPVFELKSLLFGQYGESNAKLVYDLMDQGGQLLSLRYDLTVPFARYMAMNNKTMMKRYQMGKVYRRDNPSMEQGRFREFEQNDIDFAGAFAPMVADAEILTVVCEILNTLLGQVNVKFKIKLNHKQLLDRVLEKQGVPEDKIKTVCSSLDKLDKLTWLQVADELQSKGLNDQVIENLHQVTELHGDPTETVEKLRTKFPLCLDVLDECRLLFKYLTVTDTLKHIQFDLTLARGLDYYTGIIFEAVTNTDMKVGSVAAGGRYDRLIGQFATQNVRVVGASIGIERLFTLLESKVEVHPITKCLVTPIGLTNPSGANLVCDVMKIVYQLRQHSIATEFLYYEAKMKHQLEYAINNKIQYMIILGPDEIAKGIVKLKDVVEKTQTDMTLDSAIQQICNSQTQVVARK